MTTQDLEFPTIRGSFEPVLERNHAVPYVLFLILWLLALRQSYVVPATGLGLSPAYLLALGAALCWAVAKCLGLRGLGADSQPVRAAVLVQLVTQAIGYITLLEHDGSSPQQSPLLFPLILAGLTMFVVDTFHSWEELDRGVRWLVIAGGVAAAVTVLASWGHLDLAGHAPPGLRSVPQLMDPIPRDGINRAQGTAAAPLELSAVMTALFPLSLYCLVSAQHRRRPWWPWLIPVLLITVAGTLSVSRSFFVGIVVAVAVLAVRWPLRRTAALLVTAGGVTLLVLLGSSGYFDKFVELFTQGSGDTSLQHRSDARHLAFQLFAQHPIFGMGLGTYDTSKYPTLDNQYLGVLVETGIVGVLGFLAYLGAGLYCALGHAGRVGARNRDLGAALAASVSAVAVINLVLDTSGFMQISMITAVIIGFAGALYRLSRRGPAYWTEDWLTT